MGGALEVDVEGEVMGLGEGNSEAIMVIVVWGWRDCRSVAVVRARTPAPMIRSSGGLLVVDMVACGVLIQSCVDGAAYLCTQRFRCK